MRFRTGAFAAFALVALFVAALPPVASAEYEVTIRRTDHGIPHMVAGDWGGLAYGYGYALAEDNICTLADTYMTVRAERSKYFGPDEGYVFQGNGFSVNNLNSDFFFQRIIDDGLVENLLAQSPPQRARRREIREAVTRLRRGLQPLPRATRASTTSPTRAAAASPGCTPIDEIDAYRRFYQLALLASRGVAIDGIGSAQPPTGAGDAPLDPDALAQALEEAGLGVPLGAIGSNASGSAREATEQRQRHGARQPALPLAGLGALLPGAAHDPRARSTSSGASLFGVPLILIGHTDNLAWSHTVSTAYRFTPSRRRSIPPTRRSTSTTARSGDDGGRRRDGHGRRTRAPTRGLRATRLAARRCTRPTTARCSTASSASRCRGPTRRRSRWATPTRPTSAT